MTRCLGRDSVVRLIVVVFLAAVTSIAQEPQDQGGQNTQDPVETLDALETQSGQTIPFVAADVFIELNDSDGDLGLHASTNSDEPWTLMKIIGPTGLLMEFTTRPELTNQGMSQVDFESAEPSFDELSPTRFFRRFPEGRHAIVAHATNGGRIKSYANLSHVLAAPPGNVMVNGVRGAVNCDSALPTVLSPVTVDWDAVTQSHPRLGKRGDIRIRRYQFFVETDSSRFGIDLPPSVTRFDIPPVMLGAPGTYKYEIIAQTTTGNNTAHESCFNLQ
jgi:hypothetical protein